MCENIKKHKGENSISGSSKKTKIIIGIVAFVILSCIIAPFLPEDEAENSNIESSNIQAGNILSDEPNDSVSDSDDTSKNTLTEEQSEVPITIQYEAELKNGHFTAGIDFPAGTYDLEAIAGGGNVSSSNMYSGGINAIMGIEAEDEYDMYEQKYSNIKLTEGTVLSIDSVVIKITSDNASNKALENRKQSITEVVTLNNGNFAAGEDFSAGIYDITVISGSGNVTTDNMFDGGINAVMGLEKDDTYDMYEQEYYNITLTDGVTLTIDGVKIKLTPSK